MHGKTDFYKYILVQVYAEQTEHSLLSVEQKAFRDVTGNQTAVSLETRLLSFIVFYYNIGITIHTYQVFSAKRIS